MNFILLVLVLLLGFSSTVALLLPFRRIGSSSTTHRRITTSNTVIAAPSGLTTRRRTSTPPQKEQTNRVCLGASSESNNDSNDSYYPFNLSELQKRIDNIKKVEETQKQQQQQASGSNALDAVTTCQLPAIIFDALLPKQRLEGTTSDPTFSSFLREIGIGGLFAMLSFDYKQRKTRQYGTVCKIVGVDVGRKPGIVNPTSVTFQIEGLQRCRVLLSKENCDARVGRWRRMYDPDGEESRLGWGLEKCVANNSSTTNSDDNKFLSSSFLHKDKPYTEWSDTSIQLLEYDDDVDELDEETVALAQSVPALLEQWEKLACDERTYENTNVVASTRIQTGLPMLRVKPSALIKNVKSGLGPMPIPSSDPTQFAFWGACLINPLPPLGVSPEIRGSVLSAPTTKRRLEILIWGIERSIANLQGVKPL